MIIRTRFGVLCVVVILSVTITSLMLSVSQWRSTDPNRFIQRQSQVTRTTSHRNHNHYGNGADTQSMPQHGELVKLILAYTNVYGDPFDVTKFDRYGEDQNKDPWEECDYKCKWSMDKNDYNVSDAVVFHLYNNPPNKDFVISKLPVRQNVDQKWIMMAREPQAFYYPEQLKLLNDKFNLTMTFKRDSDITIPYGTYWRLSDTEMSSKSKTNLDYMGSKSKTVAWVVSNCVTSSRREDYVKELQKHIPVDIYGDCGPLEIEPEHNNMFWRNIKNVYKFYLALENSDCEDYITEKFWSSLENGMIPIVRGRRANYESLVPPGSYIQAENFPSPQKLAEHLKTVALDSKAYNKYHEWRKTYDGVFKFPTTNRKWMCDLCERVHNSPRKTVDIYNHFSEDTQCVAHRGANSRQKEQMEDITRL